MTLPSPERKSDEDLVQGIIAGDPQALEALFRRYHRNLVAFAQLYVRNPAVAEELVQDVYFNVWRQRTEWNPRGSLRAYLYGAVRNHAANRVREKRVRAKWREEAGPGTVHGAATSRGPDADLQFREMIGAIERVLDEMPPRQRVVFTLSRHQGLSYAEIAAVLNISRKTVEAHMGRALALLRTRLAPLLGGRTRPRNQGGKRT